MNIYNGWYNLYREAAQDASKKRKFPYRVLKIQNGTEMPVSGMEGVNVYAFSPPQARFLFLKKYPRLQNYIDIGYQIEVELDNETMVEDERQRKQIEEMEIRKKKDVDEFVQDAWWND